jgi:hypothetical protein
MKPWNHNSKTVAPTTNELVLTDVSTADNDFNRPATSFSDGTTVDESRSVHTSKSNDQRSKSLQHPATKHSLLRFIPTFFEGFQEHIKSRLLNGCLLMVFPAVLFVYFGSPAWIDTAPFSSPDSNPSLELVFVPSFPLFISKPAPDGFHPRLLISNRFTWPLAEVEVVCSMETFILQDDISDVFPECLAHGDHSLYPFCISPQFSYRNTSSSDGIVEFVDFHIHGLPGAYKSRCVAEISGSQYSTTFWVSLVGSVSSVDASFADKFTNRIQIDTCKNTITLPRIVASVKNVDASPIARQLFIVALQYPALVALKLHQHDDFASIAPGYPVVGIEHSPIIVSGDSTVTVNPFLASWSANAFILAVVCEGRYKVLSYLEAPVASKFSPPSQHIFISGCVLNARIDTIIAPPSQLDSSVPFSLSVRMVPAPIAPMRALLYAYCPKCLEGTFRQSGIISKSKQLYSRTSSVSSGGTLSFSSASFSRVGAAGLYYYVIVVSGQTFPISSTTQVSSDGVLLHLWTPKCIIDCNLTHLEVGRAYYRNPAYVTIRFASGISAPSRTVSFVIQSTESDASSLVVVAGSDSDESGFVRLTSFSILIFNADAAGSLMLSSKADSSISNKITINGNIRHCANSAVLCSYVRIVQGLPEYVVGGAIFSGIIKGTAMSSKGYGVPVEICVFFEGVAAACSLTDSSGNVTFTNFHVPIPISSEASSLVIWYLAENAATLPIGTAAMKRQCGYLPACRSFTMASFIMKNSSSFFSAVVTNARSYSDNVYAVSNVFTVAPTVALEVSCIFPQSSSSCLAFSSYAVDVKSVQFQKSSRSSALEESAAVACTFVHGIKLSVNCILLQGILWIQLEVLFGARIIRDIYIHFSDPSLSVASYTPKYSSTFTVYDSEPSNVLSAVSWIGGSVRYLNNMFFSTGVFAPLQHPGLTLRINGTDIDLASSSSNVVDQTLEPTAPIIDRSIAGLPDAPNLVNGSRVEIFSRIDVPVSPGVYTLSLCFEFHPHCISSITIPSITVLKPSLVVSTLLAPDFAVLSKRGGNAPYLSARLSDDNFLALYNTARWSLETVLWSLHDQSKNIISSGLYTSSLTQYSSDQNPSSYFDALSGDTFFTEFLPLSFTPPVGFYYLSATSTCCGQRHFSNKFLVDYAVQSLQLISPTPHFLVTLQTVILSLDIRSLSGSGLPGRLVAVVSNSELPVSLCHASACYGITNSFGIANVAFTVSAALSGNYSFKISSGNQAIFFTSIVTSEVATFNIIKDIDPTGPADLTVNLPCASVLKLTSAITVTSKTENDWANYNFPEFRVADSAGNGVGGLVASLRLLSCSLDTPLPTFVPTSSKFTLRKIRAFGDGGSYAIDQFSLVKESLRTDVYKLEITVPGLGSVTTAPFLVRSVEVPDPVAVSVSRSFLILGLPAVIVVFFANMRQRHFITFIIATGAIGLYTLIALIYCSDALTLKGLSSAPSLMIGSMLVMLLALAVNCAICGVMLATYMVRMDYYDSNIKQIMIGLSGLLTKVDVKSEETVSGEIDQTSTSKSSDGSSEAVDLDAIINAQEKPPFWKRALAFFATRQVTMTNKSQAELVAEINAKKRKAMALLFKTSGKKESMALSGFSFHSRMFTSLTVSFTALLCSFLICITLVDWLEVLLGLGRAKVVQSRWARVRPDASLRVSPPSLFEKDDRMKSIANQSIGPQGIMFAVM